MQNTCIVIVFYLIFVSTKRDNKMTTREILTENRDSVISSIKYIFKIWKTEDVKAVMTNFLAYAEENLSVEKFATCSAKKTYLKGLVQGLKNKEQKATNLRMYGTESPKLADLVNYGHEDEKFDILKKEWGKY